MDAIKQIKLRENGILNVIPARDATIAKEVYITFIVNFDEPVTAQEAQTKFTQATGLRPEKVKMCGSIYPKAPYKDKTRKLHNPTPMLPKEDRFRSGDFVVLFVDDGPGPGSDRASIADELSRQLGILIPPESVQIKK